MIIFTLSTKEIETAKKWLDKHSKKCKWRYKHPSTDGSSISYTFIPGGLGVTCIVRCGCGAKKNITDFDKW